LILEPNVQEEGERRRETESERKREVGTKENEE
jgi:hypothetical protein